MYKVTNRKWSVNHTNLYRWCIEILQNGELYYHLFNSQKKAKEDYKTITTSDTSLITLIKGDFELDGANNLHRYYRNNEKVIKRK